jgi:hypothetical protein
MQDSRQTLRFLSLSSPDSSERELAKWLLMERTGFAYEYDVLKGSQDGQDYKEVYYLGKVGTFNFARVTAILLQVDLGKCERRSF